MLRYNNNIYKLKSVLMRPSMTCEVKGCTVLVFLKKKTKSTLSTSWTGKAELQNLLDPVLAKPESKYKARF